MIEADHERRVAWLLAQIRCEEARSRCHNIVADALKELVERLKEIDPPRQTGACGSGANPEIKI